ncbi:MAG: DoxX family membrane protein [Myxococcota bacterium]
MTAADVAWVSLRSVYAWMFIYPAIGLVRDWRGTVETTALLFKWQPALFAASSVAAMFIGGLMILLGAFGWIAGLYFFVFCLGGARIHYRLAAKAGQTKPPSDLQGPEQDAFAGLVGLAVVGHVTSAQKNFVLAAVGLFFFLMGTGPCSIADSVAPFFGE